MKALEIFATVLLTNIGTAYAELPSWESFIADTNKVSAIEQHRSEAGLFFTQHPNSYVSPFSLSGRINFYLDCAGSDSNDGSTPMRAFRTFSRLRLSRVSPGTVIALKRGCTWIEHLKMDYVGTARDPIVVTSYGSPSLPMPRILVRSGQMPIYDGMNRARDIFSGISVTGKHQIIEGLSVIGDQSVLGKGPSKILADGSISPDFRVNCQYQKTGWVAGIEVYGNANANILRFNDISQHATGIHLYGAGSSRPLQNYVYGNWIYYNNVMRTLTTPNGRMHPLVGVSTDIDDAGASAVSINNSDKNVFHKNNIFGNAGCSLDYVFSGQDWGFDGNSFELYAASDNQFFENAAFDFNFAEIGSGPGLPYAARNKFLYNTFWSFPVPSNYQLKYLFITAHTQGAFAGAVDTIGDETNNVVLESTKYPW